MDGEAKPSETPDALLKALGEGLTATEPRFLHIARD